jgi:hypothetical protein
MRFSAVICCFTAVLLPQLALATTPPGEVGALEAVYAFCVKVDPSQRLNFEEHANSYLAGLTPAQIAALRKSSEYQRGYRMLAGILPQLKGADAVEACQAIAGHEEKRDPHKRPH